MQIKAVTLKEKLEIVEGETKAGKKYTKQVIVVEDSSGKYPIQIALQVWNDLCDAIKKVSIGTVMDVMVKVESREYNGRWYTDCSLQKFNVGVAAGEDTAIEANDLPWD